MFDLTSSHQVDCCGLIVGSRKKSNLHKIAEHVNRNMFSVEQNDYTFRVGDHAYVILDEEKLDKVRSKLVK